MLLRVLFLIAGLALLPVAHGAEMEGTYIPVSASVLHLCAPMETLDGALIPEPAFGSLTGLIDFSLTDSLLAFLDEYVMASLQSHDLRAMLYSITDAKPPELAGQTL
jgi:hypothetical protein